MKQVFIKKSSLKFITHVTSILHEKGFLDLWDFSISHEMILNVKGWF
jgi:hypothetical protein